MLFNSPEFLFLFLPISLWVFHRLCLNDNAAGARAWLIFASLAFYGWWEPSYLLLIIASIVVNYALARVLAHLPEQHATLRWLCLALGVFANLAAIAWFKYVGFLLDTSNQLFGSEFHIRTVVLPLAISFFTFQQIAYLVEVYRRRHGAGPLGDYLLFVTFFPQLIAGPIVNYRDMAPQFSGLKNGLLATNLLLGLMLFSIGLFKKVIVADGVAPYSDTVFGLAATGVQLGLLEAWTGALAYSIQLYFDFSGYSDMAIGLGCMLGIRLPKNFESPYKASSIIDFWRRWHISLSTFLRDYLYVPLGGSQRGSVRTLINLMIVMVLGGLWHGAGWTFIAWGALHGFYLLVNHLWRRVVSRPKGADTGAYAQGMVIRLVALPYVVMSHGLTLLAVVIAWVLFRATTMSEAAQVLRGMFGLNGLSLPTTWVYRKPELADTLMNFGVSFKELPTLGPLFTPLADALRILGKGNALDNAGTLTALLSLSIPIIAVFVLPNSGRLLHLKLSPKVLWLIAPVCAVLGAYGAVGGSGTSQFLYFNF